MTKCHHIITKYHHIIRKYHHIMTKYHQIITKYHHIMKHLIIRQLWRSIWSFTSRHNINYDVNFFFKASINYIIQNYNTYTNKTNLWSIIPCHHSSFVIMNNNLMTIILVTFWSMILISLTIFQTLHCPILKRVKLRKLTLGWTFPFHWHRHFLDNA